MSGTEDKTGKQEGSAVQVGLASFSTTESAAGAREALRDAIPLDPTRPCEAERSRLATLVRFVEGARLEVRRLESEIVCMKEMRESMRECLVSRSLEASRAREEVAELQRGYDKRCEELYAAIDARDSASVVGHEEERESVALWLEERGRRNLARQIRAQAHRGVEVPRGARPVRRSRVSGVQRGAKGQAEIPSGAVLRLAERVANLERLVTGSNGKRVKPSKRMVFNTPAVVAELPPPAQPEARVERNPLEGAEENVSEGSPSREEEVPDG